MRSHVHLLRNMVSNHLTDSENQEPMNTFKHEPSNRRERKSPTKNLSSEKGLRKRLLFFVRTSSTYVK